MRQFLCLTALLCLVFAQHTEVFAQKKTAAKGVQTASPAASPQVAPNLTPEQAVTNLRAFAKLYGYIRYFHPSDEASRLDWDKFVVVSISKVKNAHTNDELKTILEELFLPIAPTLQILRSGEKPKMEAIPGNPVQHKLIVWQHKGIGLGSGMSSYYKTYQSIRTNRPSIATLPNFGSITQCLRADTPGKSALAALKGKQIKFTGAVRTEVKGTGNAGQLWFRVDKMNRSEYGFFDNMDNRPVTLKEWREYSIVGDVDTGAVGVCFGCFLTGRGKVWVDDIRLFARSNVREDWRPIPIRNGSFEEYLSATTATASNSFTHWGSSPHYKFTADTVNPYFGRNSVAIEDKGDPTRMISDDLFPQKPSAGEYIVKELGGGLQCAFSIALYADSVSTLGATEKSANAFNRMKDEVEQYDNTKMVLEQESVRLAHVIIAWNVLQHSYPYFDVVKVNWNDVLTTSLQQMMYAYTKEDGVRVMRQMLEKLQDGHAGYYDVNTQSFFSPMQIAAIEGKPVVIASQDTLLRRGDVIVSIDGKDAVKRLEEEKAIVSGSEQWKRALAASKLREGNEVGVDYTILRNAATITVNTRRRRYEQVFEYPALKQLSGSTPNDAVWYVDMGQITMKEFTAKVQDLAIAKGIILDLRGYPNNTHDILCHLTDTAITSARWNKPYILYPDQERLVGYDTSGRWKMQPKTPRLKGKIIFLTGGGAISYAESVMGIVEHYRLGEIVGSTTAAANGNVNSFTLPGKYSFAFTGMKVLKHDGSQHHLVGIRPTVPAVRTLKGVQEGRDEVLEKALSLIP